MAKLPHSFTRTFRFRKGLFLCCGAACAGAGGGGDGDLGAGSCTLGSWPTSTSCPVVAPLQVTGHNIVQQRTFSGHYLSFCLILSTDTAPDIPSVVSPASILPFPLVTNFLRFNFS